MSMYKNLMTVCCAAALALGLAACGGGGGSDGPTAAGGGTTSTGPTGMPVTLANLQGGMIVAPGTYEISGDAAALMAILDDLEALTVPEGGYAPGAEVTAGDLTLQCSANSETNCDLRINDNGTVTTMGTILVATTGTMLPDDRTPDQMRADTESNVVAGFSAAVTETGNAETAKKAADTALTTAEDNAAKLDALSVQGNSGAATTNAATVLAQRDAVGTALTNANTTKTNLGTAKADAEDTAKVPMDHPDRANLIAAIDAAIEDVDSYIEAIEGIRDGDELKAALEAVEKNAAHGYKAAAGDDPETLGTARGVGEKVAMDVAMVLVNDPDDTTGGQGGTHVDTIANTAANDADDPILDADMRFNFVDGPIPLTGAASTHVFYRDNEANGRVSMTWAELAASLSLEQEWIQIGLGTSLTDGSQQTVGAYGVLADGSEPTTEIAGLSDDASERSVFTGATWNGIPGLFVCWDGPCGVEDGKLASAERTVGTLKRTGHWYFVPQSQNSSVETVDGFHPSASRSRYYVSTGDDTYGVDTMFARFGYWLDMYDDDSDTATPDVLRMRRFAVSSGRPTVDAEWTTVNTAADATSLTDESATYEGPARGMSVLKGLKADESFGPVASGHFTADVELTATFGGSPTLGGKIDNFQSDDGAVNPGWIVTLTDVAVSGGTIPEGQAEGSGPAGVGHPGGVGQNGDWTAAAYGPADARPAGITGTFDAHFADGHAAGVYATRKRN